MKSTIVIGAALLLAMSGGVAPHSSLAASPDLVTVSGTDPYLGCTPQPLTTNPPGVVDARTEVEPYVAVNLTTVGTDHVNLIGVWQQDRLTNAEAQGLVAAYSFDDGRTWGETPLPFSACGLSSSPFHVASDPWVSVGPDGTAYAMGLADNDGTSAIEASASTDGGRTWSDPATVTASQEARYINDKEMVLADPNHAGVAYASWNRIDRSPTPSNPSPAWFAKTTDGGKTWKTKPILSASETTLEQFVTLAIDPRSDKLYAFYAQGTLHQKYRSVCVKKKAGTCVKKSKKKVGQATVTKVLAMSTSTDGGAHWSRSPSITPISPSISVGPTDDGGGGHSAHLTTMQASPPGFRVGEGGPSAAIDPTSGHIVVTWTDVSPGSGQVKVVRSIDGGKHWSAPVVLGNGSTIDATPTVTVTSAGTFGVIYVSLTPPLTAASVPATLWIRTSTDGESFGAPRQIGEQFDFTRSPLTGNQYFLGDYQGLAAAGTELHPFFAVPAGPGSPNATDILTTAIAP